MTQFWTLVSSTFQHSITYTGAYVLCFYILVGGAKMALELAAQSLALHGFLFSWTTSFQACMSTAVQRGFASAETLRGS